MKKLLISLESVSLISTSFAQAGVSAVNNSKIDSRQYLLNNDVENQADTFKMSLLTENFDVDGNNELITNRSYDKTAEMQDIIKRMTSI